MKRIVITEQEYWIRQRSFRELQSSKQRYHFKTYMNDEGMRVEQVIPNKMTATFQKLEKEYKDRNKHKIKEWIYLLKSKQI